MANGIEDLREKNKGHIKPTKSPKYASWTNKYGSEDAEMLREKSEYWSVKKNRRNYYDD